MTTNCLCHAICSLVIRDSNGNIKVEMSEVVNGDYEMFSCGVRPTKTISTYSVIPRNSPENTKDPCTVVYYLN